MALHTNLPIYKLAYDLLGLAADITRNMPRDFKQTLGRKIHEECVEMLVLIARANAASASSDRQGHIGKLLESLHVATLMLRLSHDKRYISRSQYANAVQLTDTIGRQAGGWRKFTGNNATVPAA